MQSVSLDIRIRGFFANASLVTRENSATQVIMWKETQSYSALFSLDCATKNTFRAETNWKYVYVYVSHTRNRQLVN